MKEEGKSLICYLEMKGESLSNRMNEIESRISRLEDKVEELDHSSKDYIKKNPQEWIFRKCWTP